MKMNAVLPSEAKASEYIVGFDEAGFHALDRWKEPSFVKAAREEAFRLYKTLPSPHSRMEAWRRTDPARFPFKSLKALSKLTISDDLPPHEWDRQFDAVVTIEDGRFGVRDVSGVLKNRIVTVLPMEEAMVKHPEFLRDHIKNRARGVTAGKFEVLNDAFWNVGVFVHIPAGVELLRGILVLYDLNLPQSVIVPRLLIAAGERSKATIMERMASPDAALIQTVMSKELYVAQSAILRMITLQEWGANTFHIANDWTRIEREGKIDWITLNFGSRLSRMSFGSDAVGEGASAELDGLYFATGDQHLDQITLQVHSAPHTTSNLLYKGVVKDKARSVYQGMIIAREGANGVDAYQKNNNLVLSDGARADSLPGLRIDTDDLKCGHGSTIGSLDADQLFYLRSRGLDETEARRTLIKGFFEDIAGRIPYEFVREAVTREIDARIG
jgi:Fe-S cluster assembly protein SufD